MRGEQSEGARLPSRQGNVLDVLSGSRSCIALPLRGSLALLLTLVMLATSGSVAAQPAPDDNLSTAVSFRSYVVHLGNPNWVIAVTSPNQNVDAQIHQRERVEMSAVLQSLAKTGRAGSFTYDDVQNVFHVQLSDAGRDALATNSLVESIEPELLPVATNPLKRDL